MKKTIQAIVFALFFTSSSFYAFAGQNVDAGLYDPVAPEGSAFVRFYGDKNLEKIAARGKTYPALQAKTPSSYYVVKAAEKVKIEIDAHEMEQTLESGAFYTVMAGEKLTLLKDGTNADKTKSLVTLYNLTGQDGLTLAVAGKNIPVIEGVPNGGSGWRAINPMKLAFTLQNDGKDLGSSGERVLDRGQSYSVFAAKKDDTVNLIWAQNTTNTRQ